MSLLIKWGKERFHLPFPSPDTKLSALRSTLSDLTGLHPNVFKIIHAGAIMRDENAPLTSYGLRPNSTIYIIGRDQPPTQAPVVSRAASKESAPATEQSTIDRIRTELTTIRTTLVPSLDIFLTYITPPNSDPSANPPLNKAQLEQEHVRLGELLLQALLRLDVLTLDGEWVEARKERKGAVREVQGLLDRLDGGWKAHTDARH